MDNDKFQEDLKVLRKLLRGQRLAMGGMIGCLLIALMIIYQILGAQRVVVTPPQVSKPFWVSGGDVDASYLEQMGGYVAWLMLDVTPSTINWKKDALLSFVEPDEYGNVKIRQEVEAERLKKLNASTYFLLQQLEPDQAKQNVLLTGRLRTFINGQETSVVPKRYLAQFSYRGGRTHLKTFTEVPNDPQNLAMANGVLR
jgi:conjugal transfer pilus assembly protein TraE